MGYTYRRSAFDEETTVTAGEQGLEIERAGAARTLPYAEVASVRLSYSPTRFDDSRYECRIQRRGGDGLLITSTSYKGFASFENRKAEYRDFVVLLHERLGGWRGVRFLRGDLPLRYWLSLGCGGGGLVLLAIFLFATGLMYVTGIALAKLVLLLLMLPLGIRYARTNKPSTYDPAALPERLLP